jgi:ribosome-binding ATPase
MALQIGIVGLPNVGKSTLFNALTKEGKAQAANYPFCTIDPNVGIVEVPDKRLFKLAEMVKPERILPTTVEFVDIAGLVKGASEGEGLGNKFLSHIRECDAIAQVVRIFEDDDITHVHESVDPKRDIEIIETELILADLQTLEKRLDKAKAQARAGDKDVIKYAELLERVYALLAEGKRAVSGNFSVEEKLLLKDLHLLTLKKVMYIANVHENEVAKCTPEFLHERLGVSIDEQIIPISAKIEEELAVLSLEEVAEFLEDLGLKESGLDALVHAAYKTLNLETYFTAGVKEVRAWTYSQGSAAPVCAGVIHTDFEKGFIAAAVVSYEDFVACGGEHGAKEKGKLRIEGRDYIMKDGDVVHFRFNV